MQDILIILACIAFGMGVGVYYQKNASVLRAADKVALCAVYGLLFILGAKLGADSTLIENLPALGARALCISFCCTAGSVLCLMAAQRFFSGISTGAARVANSVHGTSSSIIPASAPAPSCVAAPSGASLPSPLWGTVRILAFFSLGIILAYFSVLPLWASQGSLATYALYMLVFAVGIGLGADLKAFRIVRDMHVKILAVPALIIAGTALGAAVAAFLLPGASLRDTLSVGAGFGYYSLSSLLIESSGNAALASVALLANILREIMGILGAPLLARFCGRLAPVGAAGATAMDTCLPVIARFSGERFAVIAVFSGMVLTLLVPFLVTAVLQW